MSNPPLLTIGLLEQFVKQLRQHRAPLADLLQPGLNGAQMDRRTAPLGLSLPHEARVWWGWHDGARNQPNERVRSFGPGILISLDEAIQRWQMMREVAVAAAQGEVGDWGNPDFHWRPEWLSIATRGADAVCDTSASPGAPTPIHVVDFHADPEDSQRIRARSFGEMVTWWIEALDVGAYHYDHQVELWRRKDSLIANDRLNSRLL